VLSLSGEGLSETKVLEGGKTAEVSPRVAENWAIVVPEYELSNDESIPLKATLIAYSAMASLADYQKKISAITNKPGFKATLTMMRSAYAEDLAKSQAKKRKPGQQTEEEYGDTQADTGTSLPGIKIPGVDSPPTSSIPIPGIRGASSSSGGTGSSPSIDIPGVPKSPNDR
jgi:hypothetical protein